MDFDDRLYAISDRRACRPLSLPEAWQAALEGGSRLLQLREKDLDDDALLSLAIVLRERCSRYGAKLFVNRRVEVAFRSGADGLHVGFDALDRILGWKREAGRPFGVGVSTHSRAEALEAEAAGADFVTLGPVFDTPSKRGMGEPLGIEVVAQAVADCRIPVFALGGITVDRLADLRRAGIRRVGAIRSVLAQADIEAAVRRLLYNLEREFDEG